jgi:hypothetical protein
MPSLKINDLNEIFELSSEDKKKFNFFVETGTYQGDTIMEMSNFFKKLYTIELSDELYEKFQSREYDKNKVKSILGDSSEVMGQVIGELNGPTVFFLDGHYSSCGTAKGVKDVPLYEELESITNLFIYECIIIIDDLRLFGTYKTEDWSEISKDKLLKTVSGRLEEFHEINDRLVIKLKNNNR